MYSYLVPTHSVPTNYVTTTLVTLLAFTSNKDKNERTALFFCKSRKSPYHYQGKHITEDFHELYINVKDKDGKSLSIQLPRSN